jgi:hypothetical protein
MRAALLLSSDIELGVLDWDTYSDAALAATIKTVGTQNQDTYRSEGT